MDKDLYIKLGINIKKYRCMANLTQQQLADMIGKGLNFVGKIEIAFSKPSLDTVIDIAKALNVPLDVLFKFDNQ